MFKTLQVCLNLIYIMNYITWTKNQTVLFLRKIKEIMASGNVDKCVTRNTRVKNNNMITKKS